MPSWVAVLLIYTMVTLGGCALAEVPAQNRATEAENRRVYAIYQSYMQSMNEQREQAGVNPAPIKSYEEWQRSPGTQ